MSTTPICSQKSIGHDVHVHARTCSLLASLTEEAGSCNLGPNSVQLTREPDGRDRTREKIRPQGLFHKAYIAPRGTAPQPVVPPLNCRDVIATGI